MLLSASVLLPFLLLPCGLLADDQGRPGIIHHDAVVGFPETVPDDWRGVLYKKYRPSLALGGGCVPYPAVDAEGNIGGGLKPTGFFANGDCNNSPGQVYVRGERFNGLYAIMYSWYFPKSQSSPGIGQRHDWQNILLWLAYPAEDAVVLAVNVQVHDKYTYKDVKKVSWHFTQPLLQYKSGASWFQGPVLGLTDSWTAETQPMIAWENLTDAARWALNLTDWGAATAAFTDVHLSRWLDTANWYSGTPS